MNSPEKRTLDQPPYLQLAVDIPYREQVDEIFRDISFKGSSKLLLEIGTPLLKNEGLINVAPMFRNYFPNSYIIADLKTLDVGKLEAKICQQAGVDACVVSGLAPVATIKNFISECSDLGLDSWLDTLGTNFIDLKEKIQVLNIFPTVIVVHRGIDEELSGKSSPWNMIQMIKSITTSLVASAGGITLSNIREPFESGADIFIIGRAIYQSNNPEKILETFFSTIENLKR